MSLRKRPPNFLNVVDGAIDPNVLDAVQRTFPTSSSLSRCRIVAGPAASTLAFVQAAFLEKADCR